MDLTKLAEYKYALKEKPEDLSIEDQAALYRGQKGTRQAIQRSFSEGVKKLNVSED